MENEQPIAVVCGECDTEDFGIPSELRSAGWKIEDDYQLCGLCNFG
jgi:hypothetical protein